ncbi:MAG: orotidine 5'-phosphate decarboxylase / HUMPS family protein [Candidatus Woesearchaeota archaeon]
MNFLTKLHKSAEASQSIIGVSLDPCMEKIPIEGKPDVIIPKFFSGILDGFDSRPGMVSLPYSSYSSLGFPGFRALKRVIGLCRQHRYLVVLDAKYSGAGYAKSAFDCWKADAVTVMPYLGKDAVQPFLDYCSHGRGVYVVNRTFNPGSVDFQTAVSDDIPLYIRVCHKIVDWYTPGIGALVCATHSDLENIRGFFVHSKKAVPLLVPMLPMHVPSELIRALTRDNLSIHRIVSSEVCYSYLREKTDDYVAAAAKEMKKLNRQFGYVEEIYPK